MIEKIKSRYNRSEDMKRFIREAEQMICKYGWEGRETFPYNFPVTVEKIISELKDYDICTSGSKSYLVALANGFADRLNAWESHELEPKTMVRILKTGEIKAFRNELAEMFIEEGLAEILE